jgi:hypothetical protein
MTKETGPQLVTDDLEIIDLFRLLHRDKEKLWLWQQIPNEEGDRPVHYCLIKKVDVLKKMITLTPLTQEGFTFKKSQKELFLYSKTKNIATKISPREIDPAYIFFPIPEKINALSEELAAKINLVEKENESENSHKRSQPRKQATGKQTIRAYKEGNDKKILPYTLYDISAGGLALKTIDPGMFKQGDFITIVSINAKELEMVISGEVVSVRHMEEEDVFKVGVRFV